MVARVTAPLALLVLAAGCSGDTGGSDAADYARRLSEAGALADRVTNDQVTPDAGIPRAGSVTYEGYTAVNLEGSTDGALIGDTTLVADFADDGLSGRADNFIGTVAGGRTQDYAGSLLIDGQVGLAGRNSVTAEIGGRLTGDGTTIRVESLLFGGFTGADASGLALAGPGATATVNGVRQAAGVAVAAQR